MYTRPTRARTIRSLSIELPMTLLTARQIIVREIELLAIVTVGVDCTRARVPCRWSSNAPGQRRWARIAAQAFAVFTSPESAK